MISMELPAHSQQHGALHLVSVNTGDSTGNALNTIHTHSQDSLSLHLHNHGSSTPGGIHEESKKKRMFFFQKT